jgi:ATP-dependent helicase/nuclease subunit A
VLAAYALDQQGEARVANLLKVLDTARALEATGVLTFRALVRWLAEQGGARYEEEESVVEGEDVVRLMTIHKAKGLEFPVVIVPDLCREGSLRPGPLLVDRTAGRLEINLGRVGDSPLSTVGWDAALVREQSRSDAEALRLLYVSLTRAQRVLILPVPVRVDSAGFFGYLGPLLEGWDTVALEVATGTGRDAPGVAAAPQETLAAWRAERDALIARGRAGSAAVVRPSASAAPPRNRAGKGQLRGRLVHAALATLDLAGPPDVAPDVAEVVAALGAGLGASPDVVRSAAHLVRRAVALPVWQRARRATWVAREVAVTAELDGTLVDGRIDLAFEEEGGLVVVEFKTAEAPAGTEEQTALYADALARVLARPVREVVVVRLLA